MFGPLMRAPVARNGFVRVAVAVAALLVGTGGAFAESRVALVIGNSAYKAVTPLPNPVNDAKAMAAMLTDAGFEVQSASDVSQNDLRARISEFAATVAAKGPDTVSLVFYAGHGVQVDGENYLMPVDIDPKRELDVTLQAVRLNDIINTLTSVPGKSRFILLDACRNNPFPAIARTTPRGLAHVDVKFGTAGTLLSFSTAPGSEAEDGNGANSPYTTALLKAGREPGIPIEDALKRVRLAVNKATEGRQTPWESSSLVSDFRFFGPAAQATPAADDAKPVAAKADGDAAARSGATADAAKPAVTKRSAEEWKTDLKGKSIQDAHDLIVFDGSVEAYEAFVSLYAEPPFGPEARQWLDRHYRMVAWNIAVITNTVPAFETFLARFPDSEQAPVARSMIERVRNKPVPVAGTTAPTTVAALAAPGPTCPCNTPPAVAPASKKAEKTSKPDATKKRAERTPPRRGREEVIEEEVVIRRAPPSVYYAPPPRIYGGGGVVGVGGGYRGGYGGGNYGGRGRY